MTLPVADTLLLSSNIYDKKIIKQLRKVIEAFNFEDGSG
jgi:hypothetical protein